MTMQTVPFVPGSATSNPDLVSTLMVACSEMFAGAAVLASEISSAFGIRYCSIGGYLGACAWAAATAIVTTNVTYTAVDFFMIFPLFSIFHLLTRLPESLGYGR